MSDTGIRRKPIGSQCRPIDMGLRRGTLVSVVLLTLTTACTAESPTATSSTLSADLSTTVLGQPVTTAAAPTTTVPPEPRPAAAGRVPSTLRSLNCETLWPGHRAAGYLEFSGRDVTNTFGETQRGTLTKQAEATLQHHLSIIDFEAVPAEFEGTAPAERETAVSRLLPTETSCDLEVLIDGKLRVHHWTEWPHENLVALIDFLRDEVWPLGHCKSTTSMHVQVPCNYLVVD